MSATSYKSTILFLIVTITLVMSLIFPSAVFADDGVPPPDGTAEPAPPTEEVVVPEGETLTDDTTSPSEKVTVPEGEIATGDASETIPSTEEVALSGGDALTDETSEVSVMDVVDAMSEAGVVLADGKGDPIPLVTEEAQTALLFPDPIGCPPGVEPVSWGGTGAACTGSYGSIQAAIDDVNVIAGWTIYIDPGMFYENVNVNKSVTLQGSGVGVTIVHPGASSTPSLGCGAGSCASTANTIFYISADNVTIRDLTIDGDNPLVASGTVVNGADINARNGIFGNSADNLVVEDTEVENIYLRGIQTSYGDSFEIRNNTIQNVDGSPYSIAVFNFGGGGVIEGNTINEAGDGIASNWSTGTQVLNNTISNMGTGIHTDNTQASDVISGNTISNGLPNSYGIFVFAPYAPVSVTDNTITNVDVGLTVSGNGWGDSLNTITFDSNNVTSNLYGAYVTTDVWWYFFSDVSATFTNNVFTGGDYGFYLESNGVGEYYPSADYNCSGGDCALNVTGSGNSITGQNLFAATIAAGQPTWYGSNPLSYYGVYNVDLTGNWWGDAGGPNDATVIPDGCGISLDNPAGLGGDVSECILYDLWLIENPFAPPTPPTPPVVVEAPMAVERSIITASPPGASLTSLIPLTGGELTELSCKSESITMVVGEIEVTFTGLCGYEVILELLTEETLPANLNNGEAFRQGLSINLFKDGALAGELPGDAHVTISYSMMGQAMEWNSASFVWKEMQGKEVNGHLDVEAGFGIFILAGK